MKRTLQRVVRLSDLKVITSDDLLDADEDSYHEIRRLATTHHNVKRTAFACEKCGYSVYAPREPSTRRPYWRHYLGAPNSCPWWTGNPKNISDISAKIFKGKQESALHYRLKYEIEKILINDPLAAPDSIYVEKSIISNGGIRRPDVQVKYGGKLIAFELQLATTQLPIIVAREEFYAQEGRNLIWLTWNFNPDERKYLTSSLEDIFYSHSKNIFSLDYDLISESFAKNKFMLRVFWKCSSNWKSKIVTLHELIWPSSGLPYAIKSEADWHREFLKKWIDSTTNRGTPWKIRRELLVEISRNTNINGISEEMLDELDIGSFINVILSLVLNKPIGSSQKNVIEIVNTFLSSKRRYRFAKILKGVIEKTNNSKILERQTVLKKFQSAEIVEQDTRHDVAGKIVLKLFPELFKKQ